MNNGEATVSARKTAFQCARAGGVAGLLVVAGLLSLPLDAAIEKRDVQPDAQPAVIDRNFARIVAVGNDDTLEAFADELPKTGPFVVAQNIPSETAPQHDAGDAAQGVDNVPWRTRELGLMDRVQDWLARANREFQSVIIRRLSIAPPGGGGDDIGRKIEQVKEEDAEAARKRAEDAILAVRAKQQADAKAREEAKADAERRERERLEAEAKRVQEQQRLADEKRQADEQKRIKEARQAAEAQAAAQKAAAEKSAAEDAARREAAEQEHQRELAAAAAKAAEDAKRQAEADAAAKAAAEREAAAAKERALAQQAADEKRKAEEEAHQRELAEAAEKAAADAKRIAAEQEAARLAAAKEAEEKAKAAAAEKERIAQEDAAKAAAAAEAEKKSEPAKTAVPLPSPPETKEANGAPTPHKAQVVREASNHRAHGPVVKRWIKRVRVGSCRYAGQKISLPGHYVVARGDTLWRIALRHYRSGLYFMRIYRANRDIIRNPNRIYPCQRFYLPRKRG